MARLNLSGTPKFSSKKDKSISPELLQLTEFISDDFFKFPKTRPANESFFPAFIQSQINNFYDKLNSFPTSLSLNITDIISNATDIGNAVLSSIDHYYSGQPSSAFTTLGDNLSLKRELLTIAGKSVPYYTKGMPTSHMRDNYYRARTHASKLKKQDLFHVPFEKRGKISTNRYSIPGLPCLYLSNSVFTCWTELGQPDLNSLQVSRVNLSNPKRRFIDFTIDSKKILAIISTTNEAPDEIATLYYDYLTPTLNRFFTLWPLILACSVRVQNPTHIFKPEYIIPQLTLQWARLNDFDGIIYHSTRTPEWPLGTAERIELTNCVIPAKAPANECGYCSSLIQEIELTNPISWLELTVFTPEIALGQNKVKPNLEGASLHEVIDSFRFFKNHLGEHTNYWNSAFGRLEAVLNKMEASKLINANNG